jgi:hypothetical protein
MGLKPPSFASSGGEARGGSATIKFAQRAVSSAVRASRLHREGPGFKSLTAHQLPFLGLAVKSTAMKNPRLIQRLLSAAYAVLGAAVLISGQRTAGAAFLIIGIAWFALSFTRYASKSTAAK